MGKLVDNHQQSAAQETAGGHNDQDLGRQQLDDGQPAATDFEDGLNFALTKPQ